MDECCSTKEDELVGIQVSMRRVLIFVLLLNALMFILEFGAGLYSQSSALTADSLDMLGDAVVYGVSLYALGRSRRWCASVALFKAGLIAVLALVAVLQMVSHLIAGSTPVAPLMFWFGAIALTANVLCLTLLYRYRQLNANMSSTFECSRNDVIANGGVLVAAAGVYFLHKPWPDVVVGGIIAAILLRSSIHIGRRACLELRNAPLQ